MSASSVILKAAPTNLTLESKPVEQISLLSFYLGYAKNKMHKRGGQGGGRGAPEDFNKQKICETM